MLELDWEAIASCGSQGWNKLCGYGPCMCRKAYEYLRYDLTSPKTTLHHCQSS